MGAVQFLGLEDVNWNTAKVDPCTYVSEGEEVVAIIKGRGWRLTVDLACGHHARIVTRDGKRLWRNVADLARLKQPASQAVVPSGKVAT